MKLEYIVEGDSYKKCLKDILLKEIDKKLIEYKHKKTKKENSYILIANTNDNLVEDAKVLAKLNENIVESLSKNNIKHYILTDDASTCFVQKLYPFVLEFETKLRKFLYTSLFELEDKSFQIAEDKCKSLLGKEKSKSNIKANNIFTKWTLGELFDFLFTNNEFIKGVNDFLKDNANNRRLSKTELIEYIKKQEEKTIWNLLFTESTKTFKLQDYYDEIFIVRNDVMHFHTMDYDRYRKSLRLFKKVIKELDEQLNNSIKIQVTDFNIETFSNSLAYTTAIAQNLVKAFKPILDLKNNIPMFNISDQLKALNTLNNISLLPNLGIPQSLIDTIKLISNNDPLINQSFVNNTAIARLLDNSKVPELKKQENEISETINSKDLDKKEN